MEKFISIVPTEAADCQLITILYADGEECSSKAGECWGRRSMHCLALPVMDMACVPQEYKDLFDQAYNGYPCVYIDKPYEETKAIVSEYRKMLETYEFEREKLVSGS